MYESAHPKAAGAALVDLIHALKDGVGIDDTDEAMALLTSITQCSDEIQTDSDAAIFDIISGAADRMARLRQEPPE